MFLSLLKVFLYKTHNFDSVLIRNMQVSIFSLLPFLIDAFSHIHGSHVRELFPQELFLLLDWQWVIEIEIRQLFIQQRQHILNHVDNRPDDNGDPRHKRMVGIGLWGSGSEVRDLISWKCPWIPFDSFEETKEWNHKQTHNDSYS